VLDDRATHPASGHEALEQIINNMNNVSSGSGSNSSSESYEDSEDTPEIKEAKKNMPQPTEDYTYTERDVLLYNLGVGAKADELKWTYENADGFEVSRSDHLKLHVADLQALPTFCVIPQFGSSSGLSFDSIVPNFNPAKLLHGEQYLKLVKPIPLSGTLTNEVKLREVLDKGKTAMVTVQVTTREKKSGDVLCVNESTVVLRGSGGFGGKKNGAGESA
jgi:multifunctional beta-oxidation protein